MEPLTYDQSYYLANKAKYLERSRTQYSIKRPVRTYGCQNCGENDHTSATCDQPKIQHHHPRGTGVYTCSVCKEAGHTKKKCPQKLP